MGFFSDDDDDAPPVVMNSYNPPAIAPQLPIVNFAQIFDTVSGEEVSFVRGVEGERYLKMKARYEEAKNRYEGYASTNHPYVAKIMARESKKDMENAKRDMEAAREEQDREEQARGGLKSGEIRLSFKDLSGRPPIDAPIAMNDVDTNLPQVGNLPNFQMRYAAAVANLTGRLRQLDNTIENIVNTNPELVAANRGLIDSFKAAQRQALNRNFDIKKNGLDLQLAKAGLSGSSTAIGTQINLLKEREEAEVNNALKSSLMAQGLKQETIQNLLSLSNQVVNEAGVELNKYATESRNELVAREQDQQQERMRQEQAYRQVGLNLAKNQQLIDTEFGRRQLRLAQQGQRNLPALMHAMTGTANQQALGAAGLDVEANLGLQRNQLSKSGLELQRYQVEQASKPDFWGNLASVALGSAVGAATGGAGAYAGNWLGSNMFGSEYKPDRPIIVGGKS